MKGSEALLQSLVQLGVNTLFTNPGTSEIDLVAAFDETDDLRVVLALFEGVATGAADGYARMTGTPAATLLHLAPGLAHGLGNLHNASRAHSPVINIVGEFAKMHKRYDPALNADIESMAKTVSGRVLSCLDPKDIPACCEEAVSASLSAPGHVATMLVPTEVARGECTASLPSGTPEIQVETVTDTEIDALAKRLQSSEPAAFLVGGNSMRGEAFELAARIAAQFEAPLFHETLGSRLERGAGRPRAERFPFYVDHAAQVFADVKHLICIGCEAPVSFFADPGTSGLLAPEGCAVHKLATSNQDAIRALQALATRLSTPEEMPCYALSRPELPSGDLNPETISLAIGALLPENAIISDESITTGFPTMGTTEGCPPHDWLFLTGGTLGQGIPVGIGAAVACPERKVICLEGDGSVLYTIQSLWTLVREQLDITVVVFVNRKYAILEFEYIRATGNSELGPKAASVLDLSNPKLDYVAMAKGLGLDATRATTLQEFIDQFGNAVNTSGPKLIEVVLTE